MKTKALFVFFLCAIFSFAHYVQAFQLPSLLRMGRRTTTSTSSCSDVPLSFSTSVDLLRSRNRINSGTIDVSLSSGQLTVTYSTSSDCTLTDAIHVNLVSTSSSLGISDIPRPGQFPCKKAASGSSTSITCDISVFSIEDCCASKLRLFLHGVVSCGGKEDTAFGGSSQCDTTRWCNYQDVDVDIDCPLCQQCSSSAAACTAVEDGLTPTGCTDKDCSSGGIPRAQSCQTGACTFVPQAACKDCEVCEAGVCANRPAGALTDLCSDKTCNAAGNPVTSSCDGSGECGETVGECTSCQTCNAGSCDNVDAGETTTGCNGSTCNAAGNPVTSSCDGSGECVDTTEEPCSQCNECRNGDCVTVDTDPTCTGKSCISPSEAGEKKCVDGACRDVLLETCSDCETCDDASSDCKFDSTSPSQNICPTCGEVCEEVEGGKGECTQKCPTPGTCSGGIPDDVFSCSCTTNADCGTNEDCINEVCEDAGECSENKKKFCDDAFSALSGGGGGNRGECCPSTSGCISNQLMLEATSVCSTQCGGSCDVTATSGGTSVSQVYCRFGTATNTAIDQAGTPLCVDLIV